MLEFHLKPSEAPADIASHAEILTLVSNQEQQRAAHSELLAQLATSDEARDPGPRARRSMLQRAASRLTTEATLPRQRAAASWRSQKQRRRSTLHGPPPRARNHRHDSTEGRSRNCLCGPRTAHANRPELNATRKRTTLRSAFVSSSAVSRAGFPCLAGGGEQTQDEQQGRSVVGRPLLWRAAPDQRSCCWPSLVARRHNRGAARPVVGPHVVGSSTKFWTSRERRVASRFVHPSASPAPITVSKSFWIVVAATAVAVLFCRFDKSTPQANRPVLHTAHCALCASAVGHPRFMPPRRCDGVPSHESCSVIPHLRSRGTSVLSYFSSSRCTAIDHRKQESQVPRKKSICGYGDAQLNLKVLVLYLMSRVRVKK